MLFRFIAQVLVSFTQTTPLIVLDFLTWMDLHDWVKRGCHCRWNGLSKPLRFFSHAAVQDRKPRQQTWQHRECSWLVYLRSLFLQNIEMYAYTKPMRNSQYSVAFLSEQSNGFLKIMDKNCVQLLSVSVRLNLNLRRRYRADWANLLHRTRYNIETESQCVYSYCSKRRVDGNSSLDQLRKVC